MCITFQMPFVYVVWQYIETSKNLRVVNAHMVNVVLCIFMCDDGYIGVSINVLNNSRLDIIVTKLDHTCNIESTC